jgi:hypothetical protein
MPFDPANVRMLPPTLREPEHPQVVPERGDGGPRRVHIEIIVQGPPPSSRRSFALWWWLIVQGANGKDGPRTTKVQRSINSGCSITLPPPPSLPAPAEQRHLPRGA